MEYPIDENYPAIYRDAHGEERTVIHNDGEHLRMTVRGVDFVGTMLDDFEAVEGTEPAALEQFTLIPGTNCSDLCGCEIEYDSAAPILEATGETFKALLHVQLNLGMPAARGGIDRDTLVLELEYKGKSYRSRGMRSGWFEDELLDLQAALPQGLSLKMCITCAFSDYSPAGHGLFGSMACFRDNKAEYLKVTDKRGIFHVWNTLTEYVQETYLCPEFKRRMPGTGYRG